MRISVSLLTVEAPSLELVLAGKLGISHDPHGSPQSSQVKLDVRFSPKGGTVLSLNDIALTQTPVRHASDDGITKSDQGNIHWQTILGAAIGVGLIVAIAESDSSVKICSGTNCPPEEEPPVEPEAADAGGGN